MKTKKYKASFIYIYETWMSENMCINEKKHPHKNFQKTSERELEREKEREREQNDFFLNKKTRVDENSHAIFTLRGVIFSHSPYIFSSTKTKQNKNKAETEKRKRGKKSRIFLLTMTKSRKRLGNDATVSLKPSLSPRFSSGTDRGGAVWKRACER